MQKHTGEREREWEVLLYLHMIPANERTSDEINLTGLSPSVFLPARRSLSHFGSSADYTETVCSLFTQRIYFFLHFSLSRRLSLSPVRFYLSKKIKFSGGYLPESKKKS